MRTSERQNKNTKTKNTRAKAIAAKATSKKKVKVVDVELKGKGKTKLVASAKLSAPKREALKKPLLSKAKPNKKVAVAKPALKMKAALPVKTKEVQEVKPAEKLLKAPTDKHLLPFRRAAQANREQAKREAKAKAKQAGFIAKPAKNSKRYLIDLRVHAQGTVGYFLSGGIEPGPALRRLASVKGLHVLGLIEYYNASYIDQVQQAVQANPSLTVLPGVVINCELGGCKDVPMIVLFKEGSPSEVLYNFLRDLDVPRTAFGKKEHCVSLSFKKILDLVARYEAVIIPSRVDKTPYRQLAIPELVERYGMRAFDLAHPDSVEFFRDRWPSGGFTFFTFSSANSLGQIGNRVGKVSLPEPGFAGIKSVVQRVPA